MKAERIDHFSSVVIVVLGSLSSLGRRLYLGLYSYPVSHLCDPVEEPKLRGEQQEPGSKLRGGPVDQGRCAEQI